MVLCFHINAHNFFKDRKIYVNRCTFLHTIFIYICVHDCVIYSFIQQIRTESPLYAKQSTRYYVLWGNMKEAQIPSLRTLQTGKGENTCPKIAKMHVSKMTNIIKL